MSRVVWRRAAKVVMMAALVLALGAGPGGRVAAGTGSLLVGLRAGASAASVAGVLAAHDARLTQDIEQLNTLVVATQPHRAAAVLEELRRNPAVRYAEPDRAAFSLAAAPNDPAYVDGQQWNIDRVQAPQAWDLLPPGGNTVVAVLDTGIDYKHPEFAGRISADACDNFYGRCTGADSRARPQDHNGHGTHVAGIIGADTNNGIGIASVSGGRVTLLPIKVLSTGGGVVQESTIVTAILYAVDHGAKVINMSFGGPCGDQVSNATRDAITYADTHDVLLVMAAGNSGGCREGRFPQNDPRVLSVAATDRADEGAPFTDRGLSVAVAAPGVRILSTVPLELGGYAYYTGTSMAAPHVSAEAALLFQAPGATKAKVMGWITATCDPANVSVTCGGRINVYRAVSLAMTGSDPGRPPQPAATSTPSPRPSPSPSPSPSPLLSAAPSPGATEQVQLFSGCNTVVATWSGGAAAEALAAAVSPASALTAIWKLDNATGRFLAFSPRAPSVSDLRTVSRLDAVMLCMSAPGTLTRPAV